MHNPMTNVRMKLLLLIIIVGLVEAEKSESQNEYEMGNKFFVDRKYNDALNHYHKAIELNPNNYQAVFRRATVYLALGRTKPGLADLNTVLEQKPDFTGARQQRGNVLMKMGLLDDAREDFQRLYDTVAQKEESEEKLNAIEKQKEEIEALKIYFDREDCETVEKLSTELLETQPWNSLLYMLRAQCYEKTNKLKLAIHDYKHASKLSSDNTELLHKISTLQYEVADIRDSLSTIRDCLKLNPDHKACYASYKKLKKVVKLLDGMKKNIENQEWTQCLETGEKLLNLDKNDIQVKMNVYRITCHCNREEGNVGAAIQECNQVLEFDDSDVETLILRAEAYVTDEEYDLAVSDYDKVLEIDSSNDAAQKGKEQAKRAKELIGKRDYYKILGVSRNANKREITKAYRKQAQKWHPDNFQDEKEKKKAEKKFIDIAAAKEVLSDEEKRRAFDNGQDPLDSENGRNGHHGGGFNGFNPFGARGGRSDFFFHF